MTGRHLIPRIAIACGGTGGHLYPGLAVAEQFLRRDCAVTLLISPKQIDQQAVKPGVRMEVVTLPAVGLTRGQLLNFLRGFARSYRKAREVFSSDLPAAVLAMGGFTSAPPVLAARRLGAKTFLHESNTIPGRANRWLSWVVDRAFIGFPSAAGALHTRDFVVTGTPVRDQFRPNDAAGCCLALGLDPDRPVVLVVGGSQGASGLNSLVVETIPRLVKMGNDWQWFHLTGPADLDKIKRAYLAAGVKAIIHPFFEAMELALGAATVAVCRAGASCLAELAAMRLPAVLVPYPAAVDDHQFHNARAFEQTKAARLLPQRDATPDKLAQLLIELVHNAAERQSIKRALEQWHSPAAAAQIAENMLEVSGIKTAGQSATVRIEGSRTLGGSSESNESLPRSCCSPQTYWPLSQRSCFDEVYGLGSSAVGEERSSA